MPHRARRRRGGLPVVPFAHRDEVRGRRGHHLRERGAEGRGRGGIDRRSLHGRLEDALLLARGGVEPRAQLREARGGAVEHVREGQRRGGHRAGGDGVDRAPCGGGSNDWRARRDLMRGRREICDKRIFRGRGVVYCSVPPEPASPLILRPLPPSPGFRP
eukprot:22562-Pelagococcus_subviridis.AAC.11